MSQICCNRTGHARRWKAVRALGTQLLHAFAYATVCTHVHMYLVPKAMLCYAHAWEQQVLM